MKVKEINKNVVIDFVYKYHYSNIMPRLTKRYLGFYVDERLCGIVTLGWGTQPLHTIRKIFYDHNMTTKDYFEIGKMCILPEYNNTKSFGSMMIKILKRWLKQNTNVKFLYTLADGIMGKCGYIYQASNFNYIGKFKTSVYRDIKTLEKIHPRSAKQLCIDNAKYENKSKVFWLTHNYCEYKGIEKINGLMFRYMLPLNKKAKRILDSYNFNLKYPKDNDLKYWKRIEKGVLVEIDKPLFDMEISNHNFQKKKLTGQKLDLLNYNQTNIFDYLKEEER